MDKQTIINRLEALDLSQYPYFEIRELIREFGKVGFIIFTLHPGKTITRARCDGNLYFAHYNFVQNKKVSIFMLSRHKRDAYNKIYK